MSQSSEKGVSLELQIAKILRKKLNASVERDRRSGAGDINKSDLSDWYRQIPLFVEAKNQRTIKIKEFYRQAKDNASIDQTPTVVFTTDDEILACLRFSDLVDFLVEIKDQRAQIAELHQPIVGIVPGMIPNSDGVMLEESIEIKMCREGHLCDEYGYCQQKGCKYSRGFRLKKGK